MKYILTLIFCNLIWSFSYVVSKSEFERFHPLEVSFLRNLFAVIPLLFLGVFGGKETSFKKWLKIKKTDIDFRIFAIGINSFFFASYLQMKGLKLSRATDGALMIALEPLITILLAVYFFSERLRKVQYLSIIFAVSGVFVISNVNISEFFQFTDSRLVGNCLIVLALVLEGLISILSRPILDRREPLLLMTLSVLVGTVVMFFYNLIFDESARLSGLSILFHSPVGTWLKFIFLGMGCTSLAYYLWIKILPKLQLSVMSVTLYVQPVLGMIWGTLLLNETLTFSTYFGAGLILVGVTLGTVKWNFKILHK